MEKPNLSYIHKLSGGDKTFENKLITIMKSEFPEEKSIYFKNIESGNLKEASENVHKLKHKISILGLEKCYSQAVDYEENLKDNLSEGEVDFKSTLQLITDYLATL